MNRVTVLDEWPQPAGVPEPIVFADERKLVVRYATADGRIAVITFPMIDVFQFGSPNDEALAGHPLYKSGLEFYSVHRVDGSSWIRKLQKRNSVHPQHNRRRFLEGKVHYVFTFQDSTLECVVTEDESWKANVQVCTSTDEADRVWKQQTGA